MKLPEPLWTIEDPANLMFEHEVTFSPDGDSVLVSSSHGRPYATATFMRIEMQSGKTVAEVKLGDGVRCSNFSTSRAEIVASTDKRLFVLDAETLEVKHRFRKGVPQYANAVHFFEDAIALGTINEIVFFTNEESRPTRRRVTNLVALVSDFGSPDLLGFSGESGRMLRIKSRDQQPETVLTTDSFTRVRLARHSKELFFAKAPDRLVRCRPLTDGWARDTFDLPKRYLRFDVAPDGSRALFWAEGVLSWLAFSREGAGEHREIDLEESEYVIGACFASGKLLTWKPYQGRGVITAFGLTDL